jgi:ABC-type transport system involved in multi-copper enzyme maturation permease subunit
MIMDTKFEHKGFLKRAKSMLKVDGRRMFRSPLFYILVGSCFVMPIVILVMTTMMDGTVSVNPQTGVETVIEGFDNVWQIIGSVSEGFGAMSGEMPTGGMAAMDMSLTSMCNINMLYFIISVLVCIFISEDFRSGYCKNLFTVRAKKTDYVFSKTLICIIGSACMILAFVIGSLLGGKIAGLPFEMVGFNITELILCIVTKLLLVSVFVPIYVIMSVAAKQKAWLSILLSFGVGMFLFMMIPMMSPLNASLLHVILCIAGGVMFSVGLGAVSNLVLKKTSLI